MNGDAMDVVGVDDAPVDDDDVLDFSSFPMVQRFFDRIVQVDEPVSSNRLEIDLRTCCMGHLQSVIMDRAALSSVEMFWSESLLASHLVVSKCAAVSAGKDAITELSPVMAKLVGSVNHYRKIPVTLLEDILDTMSAESAFVFWKSVVDPSACLFSQVMWHPEPKVHPCWLPFLKAANKFLRRLRSEAPTNDVLGHAPISFVLQTLSAVYPISEKSATRAFGSHNSDHLTELESELEYEDQRQQQLPEPELRSGKNAEKQKPPTSYSFYKTLWTLQHDFRNPNGIAVVDFMRRLTSVLRSFQTTSSIQTDGKANEVLSDTHLAPYITKSHLLPIQLKDTVIRTTILTQFWIVAQHLMAQVPSMKKQLEPHLRTTETLLPKRHLELLKHSSLFLHSEKQWIEWKKTKCQYDLDATKPPAALGTGKRKSPPKHDMPNKMHHPPTEEVSKKMRSCEPSLKDYLEPYVDAIDPEAGIEDEYHPKRDAVFAWRALRRLGDSNLAGILDVQPDGDFEIMVRKFYESEYDISIPGECPKQVEYCKEKEEPEDVMEVEAMNEATEQQKSTEESDQTSNGAEQGKQNPESNGDVHMSEKTSSERGTDILTNQNEVGPMQGPATLSETKSAETVVKIEDDVAESAVVAPLQSPPLKTNDVQAPKNASIVTNKQSKGDEPRPAAASKSGKAKAIDFQPKESGPRGRGKDPPKSEPPGRRGHPQFQPRVPDRRDMHPRPDGRMGGGGPDDRGARANNERGRQPDRPRPGERPRHHDDRSRSRNNDDRRGDGRRGGGDGRNWRQGDRRR